MANTNTEMLEVTIKLPALIADQVKEIIKHSGIPIESAVVMILEETFVNQPFKHYCHYEYMNRYAGLFSDEIGVKNINNMSIAHGYKCYGYKHEWAEAGVPFQKGVMIYLLSYIQPYSKEVRQTDSGWVEPGQWVIDTYNNNTFIRNALDKLP